MRLFSPAWKAAGSRPRQPGNRMASAPLYLYLLLFFLAVFAPLRWSIISFLVLSTIDLGSLSASIGLVNTAKSMVLPVYLLWRLRAYAGHGKITAAPIAWATLILYVTVASAWSFFPMYAIKLVGHMLGSLVICMVLLRASKGGYLSFQTAVPVTLGSLAIATFHWFFLHPWGGETDRFTTFMGAQSFAAFLAALYAALLVARFIGLSVRLSLCAALVLAMIFNGSRLWFLGLCLITLCAILASNLRAWIKIFALGATLISGSFIVGEFEQIMSVIVAHSRTNRIAAALTDTYQGNLQAKGLGTYKLRNQLFHRTLAGVESGSLLQILFGHGTCNGALIAATLSKDPDPNRSMHDEWLRTLYEWGITGLLLWLVFFGSLFAYAVRGVRRDKEGFSLPLLIYLPAFAIGLSGENFIAAAGNASTVGLLMLIGLAGVSFRRGRRYAAWTRSLQAKRPCAVLAAPALAQGLHHHRS